MRHGSRAKPSKTFGIPQEMLNLDNRAKDDDSCGKTVVQAGLLPRSLQPILSHYKQNNSKDTQPWQQDSHFCNLWPSHINKCKPVREAALSKLPPAPSLHDRRESSPVCCWVQPNTHPSPGTDSTISAAVTHPSSVLTRLCCLSHFAWYSAFIL